MNTRNFTWALVLVAGLLLTSLPVHAQSTPPATAPGDEIVIDFHIIGFDTNPATTAQLQAIAAAAGGQYYDASSQQELETALGAGMGVSPATSSVSTEEVEPNDRIGDATPIAATGSVGGAIAVQNDGDWYTFGVKNHGELQVRIGNVAPELDLVFRIYDAEFAWTHGWFSPLAKGGETLATADLPVAGQYYLEVRDGNNDAASSTQYFLETIFTPAPDTQEPNNSIGRATPLGANAMVRANILPKGDHDWYAIDVDHHGALTVAIDEAASDLDMNFRVHNGNMEWTDGWFAPLAAGGAVTATVDLPAAGRYYLDVTDGNDNARAIQPYRLTTQFTPAPDGFEPNNRLAQATPLTLDTPLTANILPRGDSDWFYLDVAHQGQLDVTVAGVPSNLAIAFRRFGPDGNWIDGWFNPLAEGGDTTASMDLAEPGRYYLEVVDNNNDQRAIEPYTLLATFAPTVDPFEPNNTIGRATPLAFGSAIQATILPQNDADWYAVTAPEAGVLNISVTDAPANLDINFRVLNRHAEWTDGWFAPLAVGGDTVAEVKVADAGVYLIEVRDGNNDARALDPYTFQVDFTAVAP